MHTSSNLKRRAAEFARVNIVRLLFYVALKILWMLLLVVPEDKLAADNAREDLFARRAYLIHRATTEGGLHNMGPLISDMIQGEWQLGTASMLSAALTNMSFDYPESRAESLAVVEKLTAIALTPMARKFDTDAWGEDALESLDGQYGHAGYLGHLNFILGARRLLGGDERYDELHRAIARTLARRLRESSGYCIETYPGAVWIPDNIVLFASLRLAEQALGEPYEELHRAIKQHYTERLTDETYGLLGFFADTQCTFSTPPRGSGSGWDVFWLSYADREWALDQFARMKPALFADSSLFSALREYPWGVSGAGDVDSGPVIFGLSTSGTGFGMAGARLSGDAALLAKLLRTAEAAGFTIQWEGRRRYGLAPLVGDAIILAMRTAREWDTRFIKT